MLGGSIQTAISRLKIKCAVVTRRYDPQSSLHGGCGERQGSRQQTKTIKLTSTQANHTNSSDLIEAGSKRGGGCVCARAWICVIVVRKTEGLFLDSVSLTYKRESYSQIAPRPWGNPFHFT